MGAALSRLLALRRKAVGRGLSSGFWAEVGQGSWGKETPAVPPKEMWGWVLGPC